MGKLEGKVASIIGAAGKDNMGQVIARRFAAEGAKVVVSGRHEEPLHQLAQEIDGDWVLCDLTRKSSVESMIDTVTQRYGRVDIAVNCTGWGLLVPFTENTEEELDRMVDLQFKGPFFWLQKLISTMESGGGSIIQISSATAKIMLDDHAAYMGTKAGTDHLIRCVANQYGENGIRANSISPGITETPMTSEAMKSPALEETFRKCYPLGRVGTSDDIAAAAVFLASDECFMTGQNLQVNGGLTLRRNPLGTEIYDAMVAAGEVSV
ncbi:SDR family oxidoreductase [Aestuariicella hydrocarbonica]|uniref:SDR family oxidoreductase n=1 Tax=Pseudomaricurvus hydrocarbonicus TaxID=1470433 RepID=A0A9E5JY81_9GAMM|nr:SDR family oxidoreductase [Aestuariicella hydrocarbonica]NHO66836.1 SDR family oxidoreductase [Aestuariicella hydrocarbonica]